MNRFAHSVLGIVGVIVALGVGYWLGQNGSGHGEMGVTASAGVISAAGDAQAGDVPSVEAGGKKLLYYRNPMGLPDTSPVPKKDSMGMDYIAVYEGEGVSDSGAVKVSPVRSQAMGVRTATAGMQVLDVEVRAVGRVEANERKIHDISPRFEGWIDTLHVSATGDRVKRGQLLFTAYSPEVQSAQKELAIAETLLAEAQNGDASARVGAQRLVEAARLRLRNWELPASAGKGAVADAEHIPFTAPANGIVLEKKATAGMRFMPGEAIFRIADLSSVWVIADVYEQDIAGIKAGQAADVVVDAFPGRTFRAKVDYLYPTLNSMTRTTPVRLQLDNREGVLRPGMYAQVALATGGSKPRLTVPLSSVIDDGRKQVVLLTEEEGRFKPNEVKIGLRGREFVEILEGVKAGDRVVVAANFLIDAESNLQAALASFMAPQSDAKVYEAVGSIDEMEAGSDTVSMNHDPIPALQWPSMTMDFMVASPTVLQDFSPGEPIEFRFEDRGNGEFVVIEAKKRGPAGKTAKAPGAER